MGRRSSLRTALTPSWRERTPTSRAWTSTSRMLARRGPMERPRRRAKARASPWSLRRPSLAAKCLTCSADVSTVRVQGLPSCPTTHVCNLQVVAPRWNVAGLKGSGSITRYRYHIQWLLQWCSLSLSLTEPLEMQQLKWVPLDLHPDYIQIHGST